MVLKEKKRKENILYILFGWREIERMIAEELNRPLEIEHFHNPYIYPIGNPTKVAPIIQPPSENPKKKNEK